MSPKTPVQLLASPTEQAVFAQLLASGPQASLDLQQGTGLSKPAVARIVAELAQREIVAPAGTRPGRVGPAAQLWQISTRLAVVAGIDVEAEGIHVAVSDIVGNELCRFLASDAETLRSSPADCIAALLQRALAESGRTAADLGQVVIGLPGVVDLEGTTVISSQRLPAWTGFAVSSIAGSGDVKLDNDVNLAALAEQQHGVARGTETALLVWLGSGIKAAIYRNGELMRGAHGRVGEIGSAIVPDPTSLQQFERGMGRLEDLVSPRSIARLASRHGLPIGAPGEDLLPVLGALLASVSGVDAPAVPGAAGFADEFTACLVVGILPAVALLDPDMVVLAGPLGSATTGTIVNKLAERLSQAAGRARSVQASDLGPDAILTGALERALGLARGRILDPIRPHHTRARVQRHHAGVR